MLLKLLVLVYVFLIYGNLVLNEISGLVNMMLVMIVGLLLEMISLVHWMVRISLVLRFPVV